MALSQKMFLAAAPAVLFMAGCTSHSGVDGKTPVKLASGEQPKATLVQIEKGSVFSIFEKGNDQGTLENGTYIETWPASAVGTKSDLKCLTTVQNLGVSTAIATRSCDWDSANRLQPQPLPKPDAPKP